MKNIPKEVAVTHPLLTREIRPIQGWKEWLERWAATTTYEEMLGLLHCGFNVVFPRYSVVEEEYDETSRLIFYFQVADGWFRPMEMLKLDKDNNSPDNESIEVGRDGHGNITKIPIQKLRGLLAEKAFDMLCLNFFRNEYWGNPTNGLSFRVWSRDIVNERLFPVIIHFFRLYEDKYDVPTIVNLGSSRCPESHNRKYAVTFLILLAQFLWRWKESDIYEFSSDEEKKRRTERNVSMRKRIDDAKPVLIEVLAQIGQLDVFMGPQMKLSKSDLAKITSIAMRTVLDTGTFDFSDRRLVRSLDEACYAGSHAAWFIKRYEITTRVEDKLEEEKKLQREIEEGQRRLRQLAKPIAAQ